MRTSMRIKIRKKHLRNAVIALVAIAAVIFFFSGCANKAEEQTKQAEQFGEVIFENDKVSMTSVDTQEYLHMFKTAEIKLAYFASDNYPVVLDLGGAVMSIIPGEKLYDQLECANLIVMENGETMDITKELAEFFVCQTSDGNYWLYYEVYNEYKEEKSSESTKKYINLKAFRVEFKYYTDQLKEQLEFI